ncbi:NAD-dependent epimerase/dehydratase family protein [Bacteroidota bacterium]
MKILITGVAGFIGFHLVERLIREGEWDIIGLDNINDYYDVKLKYDRLKESGIEKREIDYNNIVVSEKNENYRFIKLDLTDKKNILKLFKTENIDYVVNLAAQAGVRYSLENPHTYIDSNIVGFLNILEGCRHYPVKHLIYASSSSVYGLNKKMPFSVDDPVDQPASLYAATKRSNEMMAHTYSHLYNVPSTGLRFFTVFGPWGRPDMALFIFAKAILEGKPIDVYNYGKMSRDFTYIDDIVESIFRLAPLPPNEGSHNHIHIPNYALYNIGSNEPICLMDFIKFIEKHTEKKAIINYKEMQPGDIEKSWANVNSLFEKINYKPQTNIETGIKNFVKWFREYYKI